MTRTDHPYEYNGDLLKRYPPATVFLTNDDVTITQHERNAASDRRHWQQMKQATEK